MVDSRYPRTASHRWSLLAAATVTAAASLVLPAGGLDGRDAAGSAARATTGTEPIEFRSPGELSRRLALRSLAGTPAPPVAQGRGRLPQGAVERCRAGGGEDAGDSHPTPPAVGCIDPRARPTAPRPAPKTGTSRPPAAD